MPDHRLPHRSHKLFMTDGGLETTLIFHDGMELPAFAAFDLLKSDEGTRRLRNYYALYVQMAQERQLGLVLEAPTWRANADWATTLGYDEDALAQANRRAIGLLSSLRDEYETPQTPIVVSGCIGPRGDGYRANARMGVHQARAYHALQIRTFAGTDADMVAAFTMNYVEEGLGIVLAAREAEMPVAISFTLETDGRLPSGDTLQEAIERTDEETDAYPAYYMINCAHPTHFAHVLSRHPDALRHPGESRDPEVDLHAVAEPGHRHSPVRREGRHPDTLRHPGETCPGTPSSGGRDPEVADGSSRDKSPTDWRERIGGIRANASIRSHAELDESTDLDDGNPEELGRQYAELRAMLPRLAVVGGCCGTDHRHVASICRAMQT